MDAKSVWSATVKSAEAIKNVQLGHVPPTIRLGYMPLETAEGLAREATEAGMTLIRRLSSHHEPTGMEVILSFSAHIGRIEIQWLTHRAMIASDLVEMARSA